MDALMLMAGGCSELDAPIRDEFGSMLQDLRVGVSVEEALVSLSKRAGTEEFDMMVTAILVQRTSGGNLAEILETIANTIRERMRIRREVQTLTAQERMSSWLRRRAKRLR